jgi:hypothetical protein
MMKRGDDGLTREERKAKLQSKPKAVEDYERLSDAEREAEEEWNDLRLHIGAAGSHIEAMILILTPMMIIRGIPEKITLLEHIQRDLKKVGEPLK